MELLIEYLYSGMKKIKKSYPNDAGFDVHMYKDVIIKHGKNIIPLGFKLVIPPGFAGFLCMRSSTMANGCISNMVPIDAEYSGEWNLIVYNIGEDIEVKKDERICQIVILPISYINPVEVVETKRGSRGIGSTGR